jgi:hypothetical protein
LSVGNRSGGNTGSPGVGHIIFQTGNVSKSSNKEQVKETLTYLHHCCRHPAWQTECQWQRRSHTG